MTTVTNKSFRRNCYISLVLATGALASTAILAAEPETETQVTIRAERPATKVVGRTSSGLAIEEYQISYHVTFADLDVATKVGADALKARVYKAADALCQDLDKLYPSAQPDQTCVKKAEDGAMSQVNSVIKMAQAQGKTKTK